MQRIASFQVNHDTLEKGMYISRVDDDIVTYDIRMKRPNSGDYLDNASIHTFEHLFATYARNSKHQNSIVYIGPMGCLTGFYLLTRNSITHSEVIALIRECFDFITRFEGDIPGSAKVECGNYFLHDLNGAKALARDMTRVLAQWGKDNLNYM